MYVVFVKGKDGDSRPEDSDEQIPIAAVNFDTNVVYSTLQLYCGELENINSIIYEHNHSFLGSSEIE